MADITDNQRANHTAVNNASATSSTASLSLASASLGDSAVKAEVARDRLLANIAGPDGGSVSAGVVAGCAFGSYSNTTASGVTVTGFGGGNGPVSVAGASFSKLVGATLMGTTIMPLVSASSKTEVLETSADTAKVAYKSSRDTTLFVSGSAAFGAAALSVRFGISRRNETRVIRTVPKSEAKRAQKSNTFVRRTMQALTNSAPLAVPDVKRPLGDASDPNLVPFGIDDEVQTVLRGTIVGGLSVVAGNVHFGANAAISGEMELDVRRMPNNAQGEAIMRVGIAPKRVQAANVSIDIPLLGVADASMVRAQLMRSVWELNLGTDSGRVAYDGIMAGRMPTAPVHLDVAGAQTPEQSLQTVRDLELPAGVSLISLESSRINSQVSFGAAITAPAYIAAGRFGKIEMAKSRLDATSTVGTSEAAQRRRERRSGWTYELLSARGAHRSVQVVEDEWLDAPGGGALQKTERFTLSTNLRFPRQNENTSKKIAAFLDEKILKEERFANMRFYGREARDAMNVSVGRTLSSDDVLRLIELGAVDQAESLQALLQAAHQDPAAIYDIVRQARERLSKQVLREGPTGLGRLHRLLEGDDSALSFTLENTTGQRIERKTQKYAVEFFEGLQSLPSDTLQKASRHRIKKIGALMQEITAYRARLDNDPLLAHLLSPAERGNRQTALTAATQRLTPLVELDGLAAKEARNVLLGLQPADSIRLLQLQDSLRPDAEKEPVVGTQAPAAVTR